jgi:large subunit ribosomal protein L4
MLVQQKLEGMCEVEAGNPGDRKGRSARQGSIRSPLWVGGGVSHGPKLKRVLGINKKQRRMALFCALSEKARQGGIVVLEDLILTSPQTRNAVKIMQNLPLQGKKSSSKPASSR